MKNIWGNGILDEIAIIIIGTGSFFLCALGQMTEANVMYIWAILLAYVFGRGREILKNKGE